MLGNTRCEGNCVVSVAPLIMNGASSLDLEGYARTGVLALHTPGGPREDTKQLVEDASWSSSKMMRGSCRVNVVARTACFYGLSAERSA